MARLGHVGLRLVCLANMLTFLIGAFFKGEAPLDLGAHHLHLSLRKQLSRHLVSGGAPSRYRAINIVRGDHLVISIGTS